MRIFNRFLAFFAALAIVAAAVIVVVEVIAVAVKAQPVIYNWHPILRWTQRNAWDVASVRLTAAIVAAAGLLILLPQLKRRRAPRLKISPAGLPPATDAALTRKGITTTLAASADGVEGVRSSRVTLKRRRVRINVSAAASDRSAAAPLTGAVRSAVGRRLDELELDRSLRTSVNITTSRKGGS